VAHWFPVEFAESEFEHPDKVNQQALNQLLLVRQSYGKPMVITRPGGDWRAPGVVPPGGSPSSLHHLGQAFDIRSKAMSREDRYRLTRAVIKVGDVLPWAMRGVELEWVVSGPREHCHNGFFLDGRADRLVFRAE